MTFSRAISAFGRSANCNVVSAFDITVERAREEGSDTKRTIGIVLLLAAGVKAQNITTLGPVWGAPGGVVADNAGNVYVSDSEVHVVYRASSSGAPAGRSHQGALVLNSDGQSWAFERSEM